MSASEKSDKPAAPAPTGPQERFDEILARLRGVVEKLEGGNLSLEDSLKFFEEGIGLCRRGATILDSAERKVEVLLAGAGAVGDAATTGGGPATAPFDSKSDNG
jgi:exodeoxyribonuclease VII small subunit